MPKIYKETSIRERCGCGYIYVVIMSNGGRIKRIEAHGAKTGTCRWVSVNGMIKIINMILDKNDKSKEDFLTVTDIMAAINNTHCHRPSKSIDGRWTYSCIDAIAHALQSYSTDDKP
jgi:hypothetical protein